MPRRPAFCWTVRFDPTACANAWLRSTTILVDTHVLVRYLMGDKNLGRRSLAAIDKALASGELHTGVVIAAMRDGQR